MTINLKALKGQLEQPARKILEKIDGLNGLLSLPEEERRNVVAGSEACLLLLQVRDKITEYLG